MTDDKTKAEYYFLQQSPANEFFGNHLDHTKVAEALALLMKERNERIDQREMSYTGEQK